MEIVHPRNAKKSQIPLEQGRVSHGDFRERVAYKPISDIEKEDRIKELEAIIRSLKEEISVLKREKELLENSSN